jgi:trehalose synthase
MVQTVPVGALPPERYREVLTVSQAEAFDHVIGRASEDLHGRVVWNVNSTAGGGGVAELLHSLLAYARGAGVDARWAVIEGTADFFRVTKRIHNRLHGVEGDGGPLGEDEHAIYNAVSRANAAELAELIMPGDIVLLHDPQTGGLTQPMLDAGAVVVWRCHVGTDRPNDLSRSGWDFVRPYVAPALRYVFSREAFEWEGLDPARMIVIPPSIDPFSPKNEKLDRGAVDAILAAAGLAPADGRQNAMFVRQDGTAWRVDRRATLWEEATVPAAAPLVVQVSRWDRLKDPMGVMDGFVTSAGRETAAHLVLAGPDVSAVADDPEGLAVLGECIEYRSRLDPAVRERVHLAALPMDDAEENAAMVNALQRRATLVVQKSIAEGFGLTVSEAMWKARPVVASRIGGIQDQIVDGESGLLVDPLDLEAYGQALVRLLRDPAEAERIGRAAHERVRHEFLGPRHLGQYFELLDALLGVR